ncbi:unnamed protein product [Schistocephalus solidus]|uniref:Cilia- and flagella-associated protein 206 n=1 Tax=Schistocephalus solidus TaxID=70667 RepID=A0A183SZJ7_SCHSO|nr:unnamed protein product [Schistocephalus solidus]
MRLLEHDSPTLDAIKMQVFYETNYSTREEYIFEHNEILEKRLSPMIAQITGKISRSQEGLETLYRQIIAAILIKSGIGSPTSIAVIREATVPELLDQAISATMDTLVEELKTLERLAAVYTAVYLKLAAVDDNPEVVSTANAIAIDAQKLGIDRHLLRGAIINVRQHALFLKQVRKDLMESRRNLAETKAQLLEHLKKASATLNEKVAVPSTEVNPIFIDIANRWSVLQNEMVFVSMLTNLMHSLQAFATRRQMRLTEETQMGFLRPGEVVYDADRAGFCAWSIVRYRGLLIPCTPGIGILRWKGKYYGFSSIQAAEEFEHAVEKTQFTQTKRDYYSQVPTPSVFLHGLRGCGGLPKASGVNEATQAEPYSSWCKVYRLTDHVKVDLTIPVEDQLLGSINGPDRPMH